MGNTKTARKKELDACPELTQEHIAELNRSFPGYLFYKNKSDGSRECWCSACYAHFTQELYKRDMDWNHYEFFHAGHNEEVPCPNCKQMVTMKHRGTARGASSLWHQELIVYYLPVDENTVYARAFYATKDYSGCGHNDNNPHTKLYIRQQAMYRLTPGEALMWSKCYYGGENDYYLESHPFREPVNRGMAGNEPYTIFGYNLLKDTFLRYSQLDGFVNVCAGYYGGINSGGCIRLQEMKYMAHYCHAPQIEMLIKLGFGDVVVAKVVENSPNKRILDWNAKTPHEFFRLTKQEFRAFNVSEGSLWMLKLYHMLRKMGQPHSFEDCRDMLSRIQWREINEILTMSKRRDVPVKKIIAYISRETSGSKKWMGGNWIMWRDYIQAAEKLHYDLSVHNVFWPKNLRKAHDDAVKSVEWVEEKEKRERMEQLQGKRIKQYHYENDKFFIRCPDSMAEIIQEGKELSHCVGGYATRHAEGKVTILFMRRKSAPNDAYFTIEMNGTKLVQVHGQKNCALTNGPEKTFFNDWLAWVQAGSKKQKKKTAAPTRVSA